jgi:acyl-CoA thioesterase YciA
MNLPENKHAILRIMARPQDVNTAGDIFGGWLMAQCDIAGAIAATRVAAGRVVTVAVKEFLFLEPVFVGDICSLYVDISKTGNTSVTTAIEVFVERGLTSGHPKVIKVANADIVYVHIDQDRQPKLIT